MADIIFKYFPDLSLNQKDQFIALGDLYSEWNSKVNVISRKDMSHFYERHVLHSLAISKFYPFESQSHILDFGTGGGFPGIPLSILFSDCTFLLVDSIQKKINVVENIIDSLGLINTKTMNTRVENIELHFDIIVGRAVKNVPQILEWTWPLLNKNSLKNNHGIIYLKGGEFDEEIKKIGNNIELRNVSEVFQEPYFETKKILRIY